MIAQFIINPIHCRQAKIILLSTIVVLALLSCSASAQLPPSIGYMFPPCGQAGQTIDVTLGGYDWTPDMQVFVRDQLMKLEIVGEPGPVLVPKPPYWFGKKARRAPYKLPRETKARLTIPADTAPGVYQWQAANANGATACGRFSVTSSPVELESIASSHAITTLPQCVCGQISLISEVDRIQLVAPTDGPIKCSLIAASIASPLRPVVQVRDSSGKLIAEAADTAGNDLKLLFNARAGERYSVAVFDLDFCGDLSFVYQLLIESETATTESSSAATLNSASTLSVPAVVSGALNETRREDRYRIEGKPGDRWIISASGMKTGSQVDPMLTVLDASGRELASEDDVPGSTDAQIEFSPPVAGEYEILVADLSVSNGQPAPSYELSIQPSLPDFQLQAAELLAIPIGGKAKLELKATRSGGFVDPIDIRLIGLPPGMRVTEKLQLTARQNSLQVEVEVDATSSANATMVTVLGQAAINGQMVQRSTDAVLMCATIKPPFEIDAEGQDDVTKWPRGTTFPAPVLIARNPEFKGDIVLEMTSLQGRHVQGIFGPELRVGPNTQRVLYPIFLPEWLETTRTSRMVVNGVAQVADPQGNLRYSVSRQKTRMGFLPTGALLKITSSPEVEFSPGQSLVIPVSVYRDAALTQSLKLELVRDALESSPFSAAPQEFAGDVQRCEFMVNVNRDAAVKKEYSVTIRATLMKDGKHPVVSETTLCAVRAPNKDQEPPNVLVIYSDDHGWADLGIQGVDSDIRTPHLNQLAMDGVRFTRGYVTAPQCVPSRAGLITGRYQQRFGVEDNNKGPLPLDELTIAERLKPAGYTSGWIGKSHLDIRSEKGVGKEARILLDHLPHHQGFQEYFRGELRNYYASHSLNGEPYADAPRLVKDDRFRVTVQTEAALSFLERRATRAAQPWFLYLAWYAPHVPLESPEPWFAQTPANLPKERRQALAMIAAMDDGLGRIRAKLKEMGQDQNTLIFFIGDNGAPLKAGAWNGSLNLPLIGEKGMLTDGGVRVPFLAAWPGTIPGGQVYEHPVSSLDVAATAVSVAGQPRDTNLDGVNLLPYLTGENKAAPHEELFWRWRSQASVLEFPWKLIQVGARERYLFNVTTPDGESKNLLSKKPEIAARLEAKLKTWSATLKPPGPPEPNNEQDNMFFAAHVDKSIEQATKRQSNGLPSPTPETNFQGWVGRNGKLSKQNGALRLESDAKAKKSLAFFTHSQLDLAGPVTAVLRLRSTSSGQGAASITWRTKAASFEPHQSASFDWPKGNEWQDIHVTLPENARIIHLRINPPAEATGVEIQSITLQGKSGEPQIFRFDTN